MPERRAGEPTVPSSGQPAHPAGVRVLDASALLAMLFEEPGAASVADVIAEGAAVSTVNLSEVAAVLVRHQRDTERIMRDVVAQVTVEPFTSKDALAAAALWTPTRAAGLSLGDRACFALAQRLEVPVVTADRGWSGVDVGVTVQLVRPARS